MKKSTKSKLLALVVAVLGILGISIGISATDDAGKIILSKTATKVRENFDKTNPEYGRLANVTLTVGGNPYTTQESSMDKLDIILVLDGSNSMAYDAEGNEEDIPEEDQRLTGLKTAATDFIETMLDEEGNVQIGIVEYGRNIKQSRALTTDKEKLLSDIEDLTADGGTNIHAGIVEADRLLDSSRADAKKLVIILTDGIPTYYNYTYREFWQTKTIICGSGSKDEAGDGPYDEWDCPNDIIPSAAATTALNALKTSHSTTDVYTITFGNEPAAATKLATINPASAAGTTPVYKNVTALSADDLKEEFENLTDIAHNVIATDGVVTDVIPKEFKLTDESKAALTKAGVTYVENVKDGTTTITWNVGDIEAGDGKEKTLSYDVIARDEYHGSIYTNDTNSKYESATLVATIPEENPYAGYTTEEVTLKFEAPVADIPAITKDDHYNDNPSYVGTAESTITGTTILENDLNKNLLTDKEIASQSLKVTDEIIIEENESTVKITSTDNQYRIKDGDKVLGTLTINTDGTFTFISEENIEGDVSFDYHIKTTIVRDGITSYVYSNTSTVTLNITPREKIDVSGLKVWNDANNQDGKRPSSITVVLKANNEEVAETTVTGADWTYEFKDLYKYAVNHEGDELYEIKYTVAEKTNVAGYTTIVEGTTITNTHTPETIDVTGTKVWKDNNDQDGKRPESITVNLLANGTKVATTTATKANDWKYEFKNVAKYKAGEVITYTVTEEKVPGYEANISGTTITNTHTPETIDITGKKVWDDADNQDGKRPATITVNLLANGTKVNSTTVTEKEGWLYEFKAVPKYSDGKEIEYTVTEEKVTGYETNISGTTITNTHTPETIDVTGNKVWKDNNDQDGKRPESITVNLLANGSLVDTITVTKDTNWTYEFKAVPKYKAGKEIEYTVTEEKVTGYETSISGTTITNTHTPETITVSGTKTWDDNNNQDGKRPTSITVNLLANGTKVKSATVKAEDNWTYEFTNLAKYEAGKEIVYTIAEEKVENYETTISGYNITNTHEIEKITINGKKTWDDADNQDGIRPESITVRLFANGKEVKVKTVTESTNWTYEFTNLPKYEAGKEISYTIKEDTVANYKTTISGYNITNTHTPETTKVSGTKTWNDADDQDGIRPEKITINLLENGQKIKSTTTTKDSDWTYEFINLPKYKSGKLIEYTVEEVAVEGYKATISGYNITNTHTPEEVEVSGTKTWDDADNQDGIRPESITVHLLADGKEVATTTITAATNWTYKFINLPKKANGKEITYTIKEDAITGYETTINGYDITNKHVPETIDLSGTKTWNDNNNQDGKRPASITVILLANGKEVSSKTVTAKDNWIYEFTNMAKYEAGEEISYTVSEVKVQDYTTKVEGMNITNTHTPETTTVSGTKTWNDANDQDGLRPETITVNLIANGNKVSSLKVTKESNWAYEFTNLPRYENGKEIVYTVTEDTVNNYKTSIGGYNITNTHTPATTGISGKKTWNDNNNQDGLRPELITINLLSDGNVIKTITTTEENNWEYSFNNLPKYRDGGVEIVYTVTEKTVPGYETSIEGYNITNTHTPGTTEVSGTKTWNDNENQDGKRPESITVNLLANGNIIDTKTVTEADGWAYTFANLPEFNAGVKISYTITEEKVEEYETSIEGYNITNTHTPELIEVSGAKTWDDADDQDGMRPESIKVYLLANGEEVSSKVVTKDTDWKYTFANVPKYQNGTEITYTVKEDAVEGYEGTVDGMNITNKHTPITISINGEKVWIDENNIEGLRPELITVHLLANGEEVSSKEVTAVDDWKYTFENLPKYKDGQEINYTVTEDAVEHYETSIDKDNKFIIVNTHDPKDITVSGTKTWIDEENRYGRPESIIVTLTGKIGDKVIIEETKEVTEESNWTYEFTNLPEYREGILIVYTIDEEDVKDYDKAVNGFDITNTYNPETITITGTKAWDDNDNQDGLRPELIIVNLLANGEVVETMEVTAENDWTFEFANQVVYANGEKIEYTVEEITVDGYTTAIEGFDITNHHTPETVSYTVSKVWNDQNNNDRIRPEEITVRLLADGTEIDVQTIGEETEWTYSFIDLPKYRDGGVEINYEIIEDEVKGYTTSIDKTVSENDTNITNVIITNTHENEKNEITINKTWDDSNNEQGIRPETITVTITGKVNDEVVVTEEVEITEEMNWTYTTEEHDKYLDGEEIIYEIEEKEVEGYVTFYDGYDITNAYKATGEITPPNTGITNEDVTVNTVLSVNAIEIPTTAKPTDIITLIFIAITSIGLTNRYKRKIESR